MQALKRWFRRQSTWLESQQATILSAAFIILAANVVSALFGLVKSRVILATYLPQYESLLDAYFVALRLPEFLYQLLILGTLSAAFIPLFTQLYKKEKARAYDLTRQIMFILLGVFSFSGIILFFLAPWVVSAMTGPEFTPAQHTAAVHMTRIMLITQLLFAISGFFSAMLQSLKRFILPAFSPVFYNIGIITTVVFLTPYFGLYAAAWGTVIGAFLHLAIQFPLLRKCGFRLFKGWQWRWNELRQLFALSTPRMVTLGIQQLAVLVITFFATAIGGISLTLITYAQQLMTLPIRFFGVSISQAALPFLAEAQDDLTGFRQMTFRSLRQITFFTAPAASLLLVLRVATVRLVYGVSKFPWSSTLDMALALGILAISIPFQAATHLLIRAFYGLNNTIVPFLSSTLHLLTTVILGYILVSKLQLGLSGLAWALALANIFETLALFITLLFKLGIRNFGSLVWSIARIGSAAFLMAVTLFVFQRLFDLYVFETSRVWQLIQLTLIVTALGSTVYLGLCWILRIEELIILKKMFQRLQSQWKKIINNTPSFVESVSQPDEF